MIKLLPPPPSVLVCLAAYNGINWLPEQLASIMAQQNIAVSVVISVDKSTDGTEDWCDQIGLTDTRITLLPHGTYFGGAARNFLRLLREVDIAPFDYLAFADQDDIWFPDKLARAHARLQQDDADAYSSNVIPFWPDSREVLVQKAQPQVQWDFLFEAAGPGCTYVLNKKLVYALQKVLIANWQSAQEIGLHDWFVYAFARANGYRWLIDTHAGMRYRQHATNQVGINAGWRAFVMRARRVLNGWGFNQASLIARLIGFEQHEWVQRWVSGGRRGMLWLALQARQCRRRPRDQLLFALSCIAVAIVGIRR